VGCEPRPALVLRAGFSLSQRIAVELKATRGKLPLKSQICQTHPTLCIFFCSLLLVHGMITSRLRKLNDSFASADTCILKT